MTYAASTSVPVSRTRTHIEELISEHGGKDFTYGIRESESVAAISFRSEGRQVRFVLPLPGEHDHDIVTTPQGKRRTAVASRAAYNQVIKSRWRALFLIVKAKFEAIESGIVTFDEEFLAHIVLPSGATVFDHVGEGVNEAYLNGTIPPALQIGSGR